MWQHMCEVSSLYDKRKPSYYATTMIDSNSKFDLGLWPIDPKITRGPSLVMATTCVKHQVCVKKVKELLCRNNTRFKFQIQMILDPKINGGPFQVMANTYVKHHLVGQKLIQLLCRNDAKFQLLIWPWPFTPKNQFGSSSGIGQHICEVTSLYV